LKLSAVFLLALAAEITLRLPVQLMILTGAHALAALIAIGIQIRVDGPYLTVQRLGARRRTLLPDVSQVDHYSGQGRTSLRLRSPNAKRAASIPVSGNGGRLDQAAARHLLQFLDRPDVTWGPGAWELLNNKAGTAHQGNQSVSWSGPQGVKRPRSRKERITQRLALGGMVIATTAALVLTPITWHRYLQVRSIQDGPEVQATLQGGWVDAYTDSHGTHHTTHFDVIFTTLAGSPSTRASPPRHLEPSGPRSPVDGPLRPAEPGSRRSTRRAEHTARRSRGAHGHHCLAALAVGHRGLRTLVASSPSCHLALAAPGTQPTACAGAALRLARAWRATTLEADRKMPDSSVPPEIALHCRATRCTCRFSRRYT
jgi:hypothetical protein